MAIMEERYKKYINKAKSVIKSLDPTTNPSISSADHSVLRQQLLDKDKRIDNMEVRVCLGHTMRMLFVGF